MKLLTRDAARAWCENRGINIAPSDKSFALQFEDGNRHCLRAGINVKPSRLLAMAHSILLQDLHQPAEDDFAGALVWFRDWSIWSESFERAGQSLLEYVRKAVVHGIAHSVEEAPAQEFGPEEFVEAQITTTIPFLFQWDAYVVPASGRLHALVSHEGKVTLSAVNEIILERVFSRFDAVGWRPQLCQLE